MQFRIILFFIFSNSLNKIHPGSYIVLWPSIRSFCLLSGLRDKKTLYSISQFYKYPPKTVIHRLVDYCSTQNPLICANIKGQSLKNFILPSHQKIKEGRLRLWEFCCYELFHKLHPNHREFWWLAIDSSDTLFVLFLAWNKKAIATSHSHDEMDVIWPSVDEIW